MSIKPETKIIIYPTPSEHNYLWKLWKEEGEFIMKNGIKTTLQDRIFTMYKTVSNCAHELNIPTFILWQIVTGARKPNIVEQTKLSFHLHLTNEEVLYNK